MDKRLLKSLATHRTNYMAKIERRNAENAADQAQLDGINKMLADLIVADKANASVPPAVADMAAATQPESSKEEIPAFLKKSEE